MGWAVSFTTAGGRRSEGDGGEESGHQRWRCSGQNQAVLLVPFSSSLRSESIGTGITSIGHRTTKISRSKVWVFFETLAGEGGGVRRSGRLEETNPDSARRGLSSEPGGVENRRQNLAGVGSAMRRERERNREKMKRKRKRECAREKRKKTKEMDMCHKNLKDSPD